MLVAAGEFPGRMGDALDRIHDQVAHPRGVVWWRPTHAVTVPSALRNAATVHDLAQIGSVLRTTHRDCLTNMTTTADVAPDRPPTEFAGRGGNGQGGDGMMGGAPWGRPMARTADDRDGLALDRLTVTFGPFTPGFPPGLSAEVQLQGEIVQAITIDLDGTATAATTTRHLLHVLSDLAWIGGVPGASRRAARLAGAIDHLGGREAADELGRLRRQFGRSGLLRQWRGIGGIEPDRRDVASRIELIFEDCAADRSGEPTQTRLQLRCAVADLERALVGSSWGDAVVTIASVEPEFQEGQDRSVTDPAAATT